MKNFKIPIPITTAFPPAGNAILKEIRPYAPYVDGVRGAVEGIRVTAVRFIDLEPVDVIIRGIDAPLTPEAIETSNAAGDFVIITFENFAGSASASFKEAGTLRISGEASAFKIIEKGVK